MGYIPEHIKAEVHANIDKAAEDALAYLRGLVPYDPTTHVFEDTRPGWDVYYLGVAKSVSVRAECVKRKVGAINVTRNNRHRGSGYNGGQPKGPSCLLGQCPRAINNVPAGTSYDTGPGACIAVHAEQNLMLDTTPEEREGGTIYITDEPCGGCLRMLHASGIVRIVWPDGEWVKKGWLWTKGAAVNEE